MSLICSRCFAGAACYLCGMHFPDRICIVLAAFIYAVLFLMFLPNVSGYFEFMLSLPVIRLMALILLPIWIFLHACRLVIPTGKAH